MAQLVVDQLTKEYPTRSEALRVLRGISFSLSGSENAAILGPSGSGKSTLLHLLGTLERPTTGRVTVDGQDPFQLDEPRLAEFRNRRIGFIFQDHHLLPQLSALENVLLPTLAAGRTKQAMVDRARGLLERVHLGSRLHHRPAELSGGERQRVAIARALIHEPDMLLADEPTGNLDRRNAREVAGLLLELQQQGDSRRILIAVTHSLQVARLFQRNWELNDGLLQ
jgi:lipoprotein-releasing system ATP-binding protein